jgi:hypothetical protein
MRVVNTVLRLFVGLAAGPSFLLALDAAAVAPQLITVAVPSAAVGSPYRADIVIAGSDLT